MAGRKRIEIDFDEFERLCEIMCTEEEIAHVMRISVDTLFRRVKEHYKMNFAEAYKKLCAGGLISLRRSQFELAKTSPAMAIFLGKQYLGQTDDVSASDSGVKVELGTAEKYAK